MLTNKLKLQILKLEVQVIETEQAYDAVLPTVKKS